ncbi:hypothetical protein OSTOST_17854 [Ostertagia ostertagi]
MFVDKDHRSSLASTFDQDELPMAVRQVHLAPRSPNMVNVGPIKDAWHTFYLHVMLAKTILALCLAHFASALSSNSTQEPPCPDGWLRLFNSCYLFETMKLSFDMASYNFVVNRCKIFCNPEFARMEAIVRQNCSAAR